MTKRKQPEVDESASGPVSEPTPETEPDPGLPGPEQRCRNLEPQGVPVTLADGNSWVLAYGTLAPTLLRHIDEIYDKATLTDSVPMEHVLICAWQMLLANYNLSNEEAALLIYGSDHQKLADAVVASLFGEQPPRITYSTWALGAFFSNGLDPNDMPTWLIPTVLRELVATGRARPPEQCIDASVAKGRRADLMAQLQRGGVKQRPSGATFPNPNQSPFPPMPPPPSRKPPENGHSNGPAEPKGD